MENTFNGEYDGLHRKTDRMKEKKKGYCGNNLAVWIPSGTEVESSCSQASCSNQLASKIGMNCSKGKVCSESYVGDHEFFEWINKRLHILEKEAQMLKQELIGGLEETKELMKEIWQQFQIIHGRLRDQETGDLELQDEALVLIPYKYAAMETGLLQVMRQDSNPSVVIRCLRINDSVSPGTK